MARVAQLSPGLRAMNKSRVRSTFWDKAKQVSPARTCWNLVQGVRFIGPTSKRLRCLSHDRVLKRLFDKSILNFDFTSVMRILPKDAWICSKILIENKTKSFIDQQYNRGSSRF